MLDVSSECLAPYLGPVVQTAWVDKIKNTLQETILPESAVQQQQQPLKKSSQQTIPPKTAVQRKQQSLNAKLPKASSRLTARLQHRLMLAQDTHQLPKL